MKVVAFCLFCLFAVGTHAAPITIWYPYQFLDNRGPNDAGITTGPLMQIGAVRVTPNSNGVVHPADPNNTPPSVATGTTGIATSGSLTRVLNNFDYTLNNFFYARGVRCIGGICPSDAYDPWTLTFQNGPDQATAQTLGVAPTATTLGLVNNVMLDPSGPNGPRISWTLPNQAHDAIAVRVRDNNVGVGPAPIPSDRTSCDPQTQGPDCVANLLRVVYLPANSTFVDVPPALYQPGVDYSVEIDVVDLRSSYVPTGTPDRNAIMFADTERQSRTYINTRVLPPGSPAVFLPTPTLTASGTPTYLFDISDIIAGETVYIDPLLAIGYDYATGATDPNFASVVLPTGIGDNIYDIIVNNVAYSVLGGDVFDFTQIVAGGVNAFRVLGIEISAGLDPFDPTAFITGLTFVAAGNFTGSMTPITQFVSAPAIWLLLAIGGFAMRGRVASGRRTARAVGTS